MCIVRLGGGGVSWEKRMKLTRNVRMVSSVLVIGTYVLGDEGGRGKKMTERLTEGWLVLCV